ncbi:hypothetical protein AB434_3467 [Heyndrickxia coagulans]|uniref:Uncharacterized protein n=1 Tax=Heyndrickxia coagulans TaxID=1398 RepID=A0A0C5C2X6_HEYCO|nr:hypothetical protein SB48_HM08orf02863 [Heyndrickxia coagulans]AKN55872.1 hypothetical protein AB434_3467 [Heyndrickxia coagulans]KGB28663.1 hypothetical protein IE89_15915 [Heyndrickxia coagulans]KWZ79642.1 hypothetical protein HMPREF3213_02746 [Heyndrickxia coagulans]OZV97544.1 hypothetical protein CAY57_01235 [Heyndrickxia coagulans]
MPPVSVPARFFGVQARAFRGTNSAGIKNSLFETAGCHGHSSKNAPGMVSQRTSMPSGQMIRQIAAI